jgi:hypothetical protein
MRFLAGGGLYAKGELAVVGAPSRSTAATARRSAGSQSPARSLIAPTFAIQSVQHHFGLIDKWPKFIAWLSDNGSPYTAAEARSVGARHRGRARHCAQSTAMAAAFVKLLKRNNPRPAQTLMQPLSCASSPLGWSITIGSIHTRRWAIARRGSSEKTETAGGVMRRAPDGTTPQRRSGVRPQPPEAVTLSASLDASAAVDAS